MVRLPRYPVEEEMAREQREWCWWPRGQGYNIRQSKLLVWTKCVKDLLDPVLIHQVILNTGRLEEIKVALKNSISILKGSIDVFLGLSQT